MAEVNSASEATQIATNFLKEYYSYRRPIKATKADTTWVVEIDVGLIFTQVAKITVDSQTGAILEYSVPPIALSGK